MLLKVALSDYTGVLYPNTTPKMRFTMYEIYYYNQGVYYYQSSFATLKAAREHYCEKYKGYIKKGDRICKRYK